MKQKITYGLLTILLLGGLYFGLRFVFGFFTPFNLWTASEDIRKGRIKIIEVGETPLNFEQKQKLAKSYGFKFLLYGSNASTDIINGKDYYNKKMIEELENQYGVGWWAKFQSQLDSIDRVKPEDLILEKVANLVAEQKNVKDLIKLTDSLSNGVRQVSLVPTVYDATKNIYLVKVREVNGMYSFTYFNFLVDGNTMRVLNPDGKLEGQ